MNRKKGIVLIALGVINIIIVRIFCWGSTPDSQDITSGLFLIFIGLCLIHKNNKCKE